MANDERWDDVGSLNLEILDLNCLLKVYSDSFAGVLFRMRFLVQ